MAYEQRLEISFTIHVPNEVDPEKARDQWEKLLRERYPEARNVKVKTNWRGRIVRK